MELEARKAVLYSIFDAGVRAVAPDAALMRHVCLEGDSLLVDGKRWPGPFAGAGSRQRGRAHGRCRGRAAGRSHP